MLYSEASRRSEYREKFSAQLHVPTAVDARAVILLPSVEVAAEAQGFIAFALRLRIADRVSGCCWTT